MWIVLCIYYCVAAVTSLAVCSSGGAAVASGGRRRPWSTEWEAVRAGQCWAAWLRRISSSWGKSGEIQPWCSWWVHSNQLTGIWTLTALLWMLFRLDALPKALSVIATATWLGGWLAGWLAVTLRYCIKTAKPIWKLFRPSESPIILVSWDPCANTQFQEEPLQRGR